MSSVFPPGVQLAARYRVLRQLETNHVGTLFEAEQLDTQRRVALKWLRFTGVGPAPLAQQRAARARAAILVRHPQLAVVHDVALEGSSLFVVSELLRGEPLRARLAPHAMPMHERLRALADAGRAVAFAHKKGLIHGGLHPGNIFLHREHEMWVGLPPVVKVHDFGTATQAMPECLAYPAERSALGAHAFLDHAQLCGAEPDAQSDIYAFAVLLFQALTGSVPYAANSPIELAVTLATSTVPVVGDRHPGLPAPLDALIHQSLQHARRDRPKQLEPLAAQVSAYAEALAARELFTAGDNQHTRRMVSDRVAPGAQVTRMLTVMGDDATSEERRDSTLPSSAEARHLAAACAFAEEPGPVTQVDALPPFFARAAEGAPGLFARAPEGAHRPTVHPSALAAAVQQAEIAAAIQQAELAAYRQHAEPARSPQPAAVQRAAVPPVLEATRADRVGATTVHAPLGLPVHRPDRVGATTVHAPLAVPVHHEAVATPATDLSATSVVPARPVAPSSPRRTLEMSQAEGVVEISRQPTVVGEASAHPSRSDAERAGYVEVVHRTRTRAQRELAVEPTEPVLGSLTGRLLSARFASSLARGGTAPFDGARTNRAQRRVRAWSAAAAAVLVLAGISASFAMATDPDEPSLAAPPALPSIYRAQPAPHRRYRVEPPAPRTPVLADIESKQVEPADRETARPVDEATGPARPQRRDRVHSSPRSRGAAGLDPSLARRGTAPSDASLTSGRPEHLDAHPPRLEQASHDDGYLAGPPPTKDQF